MHGRVMTIKTLVYFGLRRRRTGRCLPFRALMEDWMTDYELRAPLPHVVIFEYGPSDEASKELGALHFDSSSCLWCEVG